MMKTPLIFNAIGCSLKLIIANDKHEMLWGQCFILKNKKELYLGEDLLQTVTKRFLEALKRSESEFIEYCKKTSEPAIGVIAFGGVWNYVEATYSGDEIIFYWRNKKKDLLGESKLSLDNVRHWVDMFEGVGQPRVV